MERLLKNLHPFLCFLLVTDSGSTILHVENSSDGECGSVNTGGKAFGNLGLDCSNLMGDRDGDWWWANGGLSDADDISDALEGWNAWGVDVHGDSGDTGGGWGDIDGNDSDMGGEAGISDAVMVTVMAMIVIWVVK